MTVFDLEFQEKICQIIISQVGVAAPTVDFVLRNTLVPGGAIVPARVGVGTYTLTFSSGILTLNKTVAVGLLQNAGQMAWNRNAANQMSIVTFNSAGAATDAILASASFRISVFE